MPTSAGTAANHARSTRGCWRRSRTDRLRRSSSGTSTDARQPRELEDFIDLCPRPGRSSRRAGDIDLSAHDGQLMARITAPWRKKESDDKSRRVHRSTGARHAGQLAGGGTRPSATGRPAHAPAPTRRRSSASAPMRALAGDSLRSLCLDLNERGVATVTGTPWKSQTLRRMLTSRTGSAASASTTARSPAKAEWEAIITPAETQRLRVKLKDPERRTNRGARGTVASLLRCQRCGASWSLARATMGRVAMSVRSGPDFGGCGKRRSWPRRWKSTWSRPSCTARLAGATKGPERRVSSARRGRVAGGDRADPGEAGRAGRAMGRGDDHAAANGKGSRPDREAADAAKKRLAAINRTTALTPHLGDARGSAREVGRR